MKQLFSIIIGATTVVIIAGIAILALVKEDVVSTETIEEATTESWAAEKYDDFKDWTYDITGWEFLEPETTTEIVE